jgi:osmotically-inducible protein OsmY
MSHANRCGPLGVAAVAVVAIGLAATGQPAAASQDTHVAARADSATFVAAADERVLARKIEQALRQADTVAATDITVTVANGVVELAGTVSSPDEVRAAQEIAYAQGALVVDNKLQIPAWDRTIDPPTAEE